MTTILTVHGTFASGPDDGDKWWQRGSAFESHVRELVEAEVGALQWRPVGWDGLNSETSRRNAGAKLYKVMQEHEQRGEPYCVIGHSHGGSVISAALLEAARNNDSLPRLASWICVATPFLAMRKNRFLFSRIGPFGKAAYGGFVLGALAGAIATIVDFLGEVIEVGGFGIGIPPSIVVLSAAEAALVISTPLLLVYAYARYRERNGLLLYQARTRKLLETTFGQRWISFWHANDEAVHGLKALRTLEVNIFSPGFAVPAVRGAILGLIVVALAVLVSMPSVMVALYQSAKPTLLAVTFSSNILEANGTLAGEGRNVLVNVLLCLTLLGRAFAVAFDPLLRWMDVSLAGWPRMLAMAKSSVYVVSASLVAVVLMTIVEALSLWISRLASLLLNPVAAGQIKAKGFGSDTQVDAAVGAMDHPMWLAQGRPPLPTGVAEAVEQLSDTAATGAVSKLRSAIKDLSLARGDKEASDQLLRYLTWDELIHTSYFSVARFRKLVAYALCKQNGFRASATFGRDPDFALAAQWYGDLIPGSGKR